MSATLDFQGFAADMRDPAALYGGPVLGAFLESIYYFVEKGYGMLSPMSFRNYGDPAWQVRLWGQGFQYIDNEYGTGVDTSAGLVSRVEVFSPADLATDSYLPLTHTFVLTLGAPAPMAAALDALFAQDFSPLYAGQPLEVSGGAFGDRLVGGALDDSLSGRAGADTLSGGGGHDRLAGGPGRDVFVFDDRGATADRIGDFTHLKDQIHLDLAAFPALLAEGRLGAGMFKSATDITAAGGGASVDAGDRILYDSDSGKLYYDPDGSGGEPRALIATVFDSPGHHPDLLAGDFRIVT